VASKEDCTHHWSIETASGPKSNGVCLNCGKEKAFFNSLGADRFFTQIGVPRDSEGNTVDERTGLATKKSKSRRDIAIGWRTKSLK